MHSSLAFFYPSLGDKCRGSTEKETKSTFPSSLLFESEQKAYEITLQGTVSGKFILFPFDVITSSGLTHVMLLDE